MISSSKINFINPNPASNLDTRKNTTATNKTTGFDSYLAAQISSAKPDTTTGASTNTDASTGGLRYLTVRDGNKVYTYIVIGKNFQILIGVDNAEEEEEIDEQDEKTADGNTAGDTQETNGFGETADLSNLNKPSAGKQSKAEKQVAEPDFMTDTRMFALTGYYQKKMREIVKEMQENLGDGKLANADASADTEKKRTTFLHNLLLFQNHRR